MEYYEIKNLSFSYPLQRDKSLNIDSFSVKQGEFLTICGKSGCGKTTFLRHLKPTMMPHGNRTGEILLCGKDIHELSMSEEGCRIGFVQQNPDNMTVTDTVLHEVSFGLESLGIPSGEIRLRIAEVTAFFGLQSILNKKISELSGGQKQLVNLASIIVMSPEILILDEPTSQLDPIAAQSFLETLKKVNRELGVTVIISEHRTEELFAISDRVVLMESGRIVADSKPGDYGEILKNKNLEVEPMLPTAMRVYAGVENGLECPVTVSEGRRWLQEVAKNREIKPTESKTVKESKEEYSVVLDEVFFRYDRNSPDVINGASMKIPKGKVYGIVGGNGFGKTTLLSVIGGIEKPHRGRVKVAEGCVVGMLPQDPVSLFVKKSIKSDLMDMLSESDISESEKEREIEKVAELCNLKHILNRHPYDVSGGEQQRAALAKVLLMKPDLILLDEPTKGMDAIFKQSFGDLLKRLKMSGVTIVIVSHDIEFCAEYADRCAMMFDGKIINEDEPRCFFVNNRFYTTAARRMAKEIIPDAVLADEIIEALGGEIRKKEESGTDLKSESTRDFDDFVATDKAKEKNTMTLPLFLKIILGVFFAGLAVFTHLKLSGEFSDWKSSVVQIFTIVFFVLSVMCFVPRKYLSDKLEEVQTSRTKRSLSKRTLFATLVVLVAVPLTVFVGNFYLGDRKYYLISMMIIFEIMISFVLMFEGRKPSVGELVTISVICAVAVGGRIAFASVPQFKPMLAMVIIAGVCFGGETGFMVGAICGFVSNFYFGQGPWTVWQMVAFGFVGFLAGILFRKGLLRKTRWSLCLFGVFAALGVYGIIMNVSSIFMMHQQFSWELATSYIVLGLPFDAVHAAATFGFLWLASAPMLEKLERIKLKYGIMEQ